MSGDKAHNNIIV